MKIFVAYGYNPRDKWIEDFVFPIIESFGSEVVTGEGAYDGEIPAIVRERIGYSNALIAFNTQRQTPGSMAGESHRWVLDELALAFAIDRSAVEVREQGVSEQRGIVQGHQAIPYIPSERDECLVKIVRALGSWHLTSPVKIQLLPQRLADDNFRHLIYQSGFSCSYVIKRGNYEAKPEPTQIKEIGVGLFIEPRVPRDALIRVCVSYGDKAWSSSFRAIDSYGVDLQPVEAPSWLQRLRKVW